MKTFQDIFQLIGIIVASNEASTKRIHFLIDTFNMEISMFHIDGDIITKTIMEKQPIRTKEQIQQAFGAIKNNY